MADRIFPPRLTDGAKHYLSALEKMRLRDWIEFMDDPRRNIFLEIYDHYQDLLRRNPGSSYNHQTWNGGLLDHLAAMCRFAWHDYQLHACLETLPYTFGNVIVGIFCHDAEKFVVYGSLEDPRCAPFHAMFANAAGKEEKERVKWEVLKHWEKTFGLTLTEDEINAVKYTHGEGADYRSDHRVMSPLAAAVGNADRTSARIFFDYGKGLG